MNKKLFTTLVVLLLTPGLLFAARPSVSAQEQALKILVDALVVCPPNSPTRFVDNGDGTICDHQTGLMWEMKDGDDGVVDFANSHDVDNLYDWSTTGGYQDGTVFTTFLARLNGEVSATASSEQLGGYNDWRMATNAELETILDCSFGSPCIAPVFGPTAAASYWSFTSTPGIGLAWLINFSNGDVFNDFKNKFMYVRAVRGGK